MQRFTALPRPLLELILIPDTCNKDKKALRASCTCFRQVLDTSVTCTLIKALKSDYSQCRVNLLKRLQQVHAMRTVILVADVGSLLRHLPDHITTLMVRGFNMDFRALGKLSHLTCLCVNGEAIGMEHVSGITRLHCYGSNGSIAHLAPTLKHLVLADFGHVKDINQLTNLELLEAKQRVPARFFQLYHNVPLKHLYIHTYEFAVDSAAWLAAPATLTRLTLNGNFWTLPASIPVSVSHLQLLNAQCDVVQSVAVKLPWLQQLDIYLYKPSIQNWNTAFAHTNKLTNLQSLGLCVTMGSDKRFWQQERICSQMPEVARAVDRGIKLNVMASYKEFIGMFADPFPSASTWATHV